MLNAGKVLSRALWMMSNLSNYLLCIILHTIITLVSSTNICMLLRNYIVPLHQRNINKSWRERTAAQNNIHTYIHLVMPNYLCFPGRPSVRCASVARQTNMFRVWTWHSEKHLTNCSIVAADCCWRNWRRRSAHFGQSVGKFGALATTHA